MLTCHTRPVQIPDESKGAENIDKLPGLSLADGRHVASLLLGRWYQDLAWYLQVFINWILYLDLLCALDDS